MSSSQDIQSSSIVYIDGSKDTSIVIGVVIVTLIVIVVMSITMNLWMRYRSIRAMTSLRNSSFIKNKSVSPTASLKMLTKPSPTLNKETTLPVYRRTDTWESYLKMIQSPDKLNNVVHSMKISHTPSSSVSTKVGYSPSDSSDNNGYFISTHSPSGSIHQASHSPSGSIDDIYNIYKVSRSPSGSIDNTYHTPSGGIDNTCYTSNDYELYRQSSLPKESDDNN